MEHSNINNIEEKGVSFLDICKVFSKGWLPGVISAACIAILAFVILNFIISPSSKVYVIDFDYSSIPGIGSGNGSYIDGTRFNYKDIIITDNIQDVLKINKEEYSGGKTEYDYSTIDFEKLLTKDFAIDINRIYYDKLTEAQNEIPELKETHYQISMPINAFKNKAIARAFAQDLIELPLIKTLEMMKTLDYTTNLEMYPQALTYEDKLSYLHNQISLIQNGYASFNSAVGGTVYTIGGKTYNFETIQADFNNFFSTLNYSTMDTEIRQLGYYNPATENVSLYKARLSYQLYDIEKSYELLVKKLNSIEDTYDEVTASLKDITNQSGVITTEQIIAMLNQIGTSYSSTVNELKSEMITNRENLRILNIKWDAVNNQKSTIAADGTVTTVALTQAEKDEFDTNNTAFGARLDAIYERLLKETETYDLVSKYISARNMNIYYTRSDIVGISGGMKTILVLGIPVAGGLFVGLTVAGIVGAVKKYKSPKNAKKEEEITA